MQLSFILPNKKEVVIEEILYKDLRKFSLYSDSAIGNALEFLETFICTKNLNIVEKFISLLMLRQRCIGDDITLNSKKGPVSVNLDLLMQNIGDIEDRLKIIEIGNATYELNYPTQFNCGDSDFIFSLIQSIQIDDEKVILSQVTSQEYEQIINTLPKSLYHHLNKFVKENENYFSLKVFEGRKNLSIPEINLNVLSTDISNFIVSLFNTITANDYRQMLFILCNRMPDINYLINCTFVEIEDYYNLYKDEVDKENESLKKETIQ
tara:strand:- start:3747 stop:4541 length:795 start_codon:yes stop_codon:yes gene_type:complete